MIEIKRTQGKKVNFTGTREPMFEEKEKEFDKRLKSGK